MVIKIRNSVLLIAFGLLIILMSIPGFIHDINYTYTESEIIDIEITEDNRCIPIYEYEVNNKIYQGKIDIPLECENFKIGSKETISYNPKKPELFDVG